MTRLEKIRAISETINHCENMIKWEKSYSNPDKKLIKSLQAKLRRAKKQYAAF